MALVKCPECGHEISTAAPVCPHCGYSGLLAPQSQSKTTRNLIIFIIGIILPLILPSGAYIMFVIGGIIIEIIMMFCIVMSSLFFGGRKIWTIMDIALFDIGFGIGTLIDFIIGVVNIFK